MHGGLFSNNGQMRRESTWEPTAANAAPPSAGSRLAGARLPVCATQSQLFGSC